MNRTYLGFRIQRITGKLIGNGDATLQDIAKTLSQCSLVLCQIYGPHLGSQITGKVIGNRDATLQGIANTVSKYSPVLLLIMPNIQDTLRVPDPQGYW